MKCPKCGSENVKSASTAYAFIRDDSWHSWCLACGYSWTPHQQFENDRLHVIEQEHSLCAEAIQGFREELMDEKVSRIKYQDIVYQLCNIIDVYSGRSVAKGQGCTIDEVVKDIQNLIKENDRLQYQLTAAVENHSKQCAETLALQMENNRLQAELKNSLADKMELQEWVVQYKSRHNL